jgi:hypothetical protein
LALPSRERREGASFVVGDELMSCRVKLYVVRMVEGMLV